MSTLIIHNNNNNNNKKSVYTQDAYDKSRDAALKMAMEQLQKLFTKQGKSGQMDYTSRAY